MLDIASHLIDVDGLYDGQEITCRIEPGAEPDEVYVFVWLHSDPNGDDSDGDGYTDNIDEHMLEWDVGDRDLAMFSALAYEDGTNFVGSFYSSSVVNNDFLWLEYASVDEFSNKWQIIDYRNILSNPILNDYFSATTYKNGNNIVISYRGTSEELGEWVDNFVCYGFGNYHTEESLAEQYAIQIYNSYVLGKEETKLYITGHSLGGYLAQIGAAKLINSGNWLELKKVVYFNGIGMKFNDFGFWQKNEEIEALTLYGNANEKPNGNLICYHIEGDIVSMLGTHCGEERWFRATDTAKNSHSTESGRILEDLTVAFVGFVGLPITIPIIETISYYYGYYGFSSLHQYFWTTHETVSFMYHIHQGYR